MRAILPIAALLFFAISCDDPKPAKKTDGGALMAAVKDGPRAEQEHDIKCGCIVEGIGKCGEYIEVDKQFIALEGWTLDREKFPLEEYKEDMPFCGKGVLKAKTAGEVKDGKFLATSFILFKPAK